METLITMGALEKVTPLVFGMGAAALGWFMVYYIAFAIALMVGSIYSTTKFLITSYGNGIEGAVLSSAHLGFTMTDGGSPVEKKEEKR